MGFYGYQQMAKRTMQTDKLATEKLLLNGVMGLCGEAGEVIDLAKKHIFQGHPLNTMKIAEELGDVLWYVATCCEAIGIDMATVADMNIQKLARRYPEGFDTRKSIYREPLEVSQK